VSDFCTIDRETGFLLPPSVDELGWKKLGLERSLGTRLVTYADDLVILCRKGKAVEALQRASREASGTFRCGCDRRARPSCDERQLSRLWICVVSSANALGILVYGYAMFSSRKLERVASSNKPPLAFDELLVLRHRWCPR